jgi:hypothetical protein
VETIFGLTAVHRGRWVACFGECVLGSEAPTHAVPSVLNALLIVCSSSLYFVKLRSKTFSRASVFINLHTNVGM